MTLILQIVNGYILEDFVPRFHRLTEEKNVEQTSLPQTFPSLENVLEINCDMQKKGFIHNIKSAKKNYPPPLIGYSTSVQQLSNDNFYDVLMGY